MHTQDQTIIEKQIASPSAARLYIELLKKALVFLLWDETFLPADMIASSKLKQTVLSIASSIFRSRNLALVRSYNPVHFSAQAHTMCGIAGLNSLEACVEDVLREKIPGDFIEAGVWRGGVCIFMRGLLMAHNIQDRRVFVADSFQGLPRPECKEDKGSKHYTYTLLSVPIEEVKKNFSKYNLLDSQVVFLHGWFDKTLPDAPIDTLAILRIDCDMYHSTMQALRHLYPKLSVGGYCTVDDIKMPGVHAAIMDYRAINQIGEEIIHVDDTTGVHGQPAYWRKSR